MSVVKQSCNTVTKVTNISLKSDVHVLGARLLELTWPARRWVKGSNRPMHAIFVLD